MMRKPFLFTLIALFVLLLSVARATAQDPAPQSIDEIQAALGMAFTYQGRLTDGGSPANDTYDFQFKLYDASGSQVGSTITRNDVAVTNGLFSVPLDFGDAFTGDARFMEVSVRPGSSTGDYTTLTPRQALTPAPYAFYALALPGVFPLNGNIGIGTASPSRILTIESSTPNSIYLKGNTGFGAPYHAALLTLESNVDFRGRGMFLPHADPTDRSDPNAWFVGVPYRGGGFQIGNSSTHLEQDSGGPYIKGNAKLFIGEDGNVGIGTTSPTTKLHIAGAENDGTTAALKITSGGQVLLLDGNEIDSNDGIHLNHNSNKKVILATGGGNVGIGTTSPAFKLDVAGSAHASSFPTSSDARLKTDVEPLTNVLEKLEMVHGISFEWNEVYGSLGRSTGHKEIGVIAQEVEAVFPELVTTWGDEGYRAVDYGRLTAVLIEAIKELKADQDGQIAALQRQNADLEARVAALEALVAELARTKSGGGQ